MKMSRNNNKTMTHGAWNFGKFVEGSIMKKILIVIIGLLCGSCIFSPYELPEKKSSKQFIEHLIYTRIATTFLQAKHNLESIFTRRCET